MMNFIKTYNKLALGIITHVDTGRKQMLSLIDQRRKILQRAQ